MSDHSYASPYYYQLAAMLVPGLARDYWKRLAHDCVLPMQEIFTSSELQLKQKSMRPKLIIQVLAVQSSWQKVELLDQLLTRESVQFISIEHPDYPEKLKSIADPPLGLFVKGNAKLLNQRQLAIVGSRKATRQALDITRSWAGKIARRNIVVTSGMALGIDAAAHMGVLDNGSESHSTGKTIAVLGCGLLHIYPKQHWQLWQKIIDAGGAIVSEYLPDISAKAQYFPQRNRIISGMSEGVIVIEAAIKSGSLITARLANEQGREVFALPGNIANGNTSGCHYLIQQGAKLVTNIEHVFEEYAWAEESNTPQAGVNNNSTVPEAYKSSEKFESNTGHKSTQCELNLDKKETKLMASLCEVETSMDQLVGDSGLAFAEVCSILLGLEMKGLIKKTPNGYQKIF